MLHAAVLDARNFLEELHAQHAAPVEGASTARARVRVHAATVHVLAQPELAQYRPPRAARRRRAAGRLLHGHAVVHLDRGAERGRQLGRRPRRPPRGRRAGAGARGRRGGAARGARGRAAASGPRLTGRVLKESEKTKRKKNSYPMTGEN